MDQLHAMRNRWQFAAVSQFIHTFYDAFDYPDFDTEDLEQELLTPYSTPLGDLIARMLRALTLNRHISHDNWQPHLVKEFNKRAPDQNIMLDAEGKPVDFYTLSLKAKVNILHILCEWQLDDPERFRDQLKTEEEAFHWRVEPIGFDSKGNTYWLFDDNRLYKEAPAVTPKPKPKSRVKSSSSRSRRKTTRNSRRRGTNTEDGEDEDEDEDMTDANGGGRKGDDAKADEGEEGAGRWRLICRTEDEWESFPAQFARSRDSDERYLYEQATNEILPKVLADLRERDKERRKLEAIANRKRSSRILIKELERQEKERMDEVRKQEAEEAAQKRREEVQRRREEKDHQTQIQAREQRVRERELRIRQRERQLRDRDHQRKKEQERLAREREKRATKRRITGGEEMETEEEDEEMDDTDKNKEEDEEENWTFDCMCGVFGDNLDDGTPMIACGRCNVWQHLACLQQDEEAETGSVGRSMKDWESVEFVCRSCSQAVLEQDADLVSSAQMSPAAEQHDSIARSVEIEGENEEARVSGVRAPTSPSPVARRVVEMASPASGGEIKVKGKEKARTKVKDKDKAKTLEGKAVEVNAGDAQTPVKKKKSKSTKKSLLEAATAGSIVGTETVAARSETQIPVEHATEVVRTKVKKSKQKEAVAETASRPEGGETMTLDPPPVVDLVPVKPKKVQSVVKDSDIATGAAPMSTVMVGGHLNDGNQVVVKTPKKRKRKTTEEMQAGTAAMPNGEAPPSSEKKHKVRTPKDPAKKAERAERKAAAATATATAVPSSGSFTQTISPNQHSLPIPIGTQQHSPLVSHVPASPHRSSPLPPPPLPHTPPQYGSLNHSPQPQHSQTPPLHLHTLQPMASAIQSSNAVYHHHQTTSPGQYHINGYSSYFSPRPPVPPSLGPVSPYSQQPAPPPPMQRALYPAPPPGSGQQLPPLSTIQSSSGSPASRSPPISLPAYSTFQIAPRPPIMQQPYPMAPPPLASGPYGQQMPPTQFMTSRVPPPQQSVMQFEQRRGSMDMPVNAPIYPPFPSSPSSTPSSMSYDQYHHHQQQQRRASMQDNMVTFVSQNMGAPSSPSQRSPSSGKHQASSTGEPIMMPQRLQYPPTMPVSPQPSQLPRLQQHPSIASAHPHSHGYSHYSYPLPSPTSGRRDSIPNGPPGDDLRPKLQYPPLTIIPQSPKRTAGMSSSGASPRQKKQKVVPADKNATMSGQLPHLGPSLPPPPVLTSDGQIAIPQKGPMHSPKMDIGSLLD